MARKVVWTEPAWEDLVAAADFIARDSKSYAATFVQSVKEAAASLAESADVHSGEVTVLLNLIPDLGGELRQTKGAAER